MSAAEFKKALEAGDEFWAEIERYLPEPGLFDAAMREHEDKVSAVNEAAQERYRPLYEALDTEFERLHPRGRAGQWIRKLGIPMYEVGGAVRDPMLGKRPKDVDYMAMASPERIKQAVQDAGGRAEDLKVRDRLVGVRAHHADLPKEGVEIAPPRIENSTGAGRHDFEIVPHPLLQHNTSGRAPGEQRIMLRDDAHRRDFTVNALYRDAETGQIEDPTGRGLADLSNRQLRTTHPDSFRDDPLRILRGARFVSQHDLTVEPQTFAQMTEHADAVTGLTQKGVSGTVREEMDKLLMGDQPGKGLRVLRDTGVFGQLFPEMRAMVGFDQESKWHDLTADEHTFKVVDEVAKQGGSLEARMAALFHDSGKPESAWRGADGKLHYYGNEDLGKRDHPLIGAEIADKVLSRLNYPTAVKNDVKAVVTEHMVTDAKQPKGSKARKLRTRLTDKQLADLFTLRRADMRSKGEDDDNSVDTSGLDKLEALVNENAGAPRSVADLHITGDDLMKLGWKPGPGMGKFLKHIFGEVIGQPELNNREWLLDQAKKRRKKFDG